ITVSDDGSVVSLFQSKAPRFVRGWSLESISQRLAVESTEEQIIGELEAVQSRARGPELVREIGVSEATILQYATSAAGHLKLLIGERHVSLIFTPPSSISKCYIALCRHLQPANQARSELACIGTIHFDQLFIDEFLDSQLRQFATVSRVFDSTERNIRSSPGRAVYENHSRIDLHRKSLRTHLIRAENHSGQAERRIVCEPYRLLVIANSEHEEDRAKELFGVGWISWMYVRKDGGLHVEAVPIQLLPAADEGRSSLNR